MTKAEWFLEIRNNKFIEAVLSAYLGCKDFKKSQSLMRAGMLGEYLDMLDKAFVTINRHRPAHLMKNPKLEDLKKMMVLGRSMD